MGYSVTKRLPCSVCGRDTLRREGWFLVAENRWLDRLRIFGWNPALAPRQGFKSACCREHLKTLIAFWLDQASLRLLPRTNQAIPIDSDPGRTDADVGPGAREALVGELSVCREAFSRVWTGSPAALEAIVDALIPREDGDQRRATEFQPLQTSYEPPYGLSLQ
jgi:hypothetical protein